MLHRVPVVLREQLSNPASTCVLRSCSMLIFSQTKTPATRTDSFDDTWASLSLGSACSASFMWQDELIGVAAFVNACLSRANALFRGQHLISLV